MACTPQKGVTSGDDTNGAGICGNATSRVQKAQPSTLKGDSTVQSRTLKGLRADEMSLAITCAPESASGIARLPVPHPASQTETPSIPPSSFSQLMTYTESRFSDLVSHSYVASEHESGSWREKTQQCMN